MTTKPKLDGILGQGSTGASVVALQKRLRELGFTGKDGKPLVPDGQFGQSTLNAVNAFKTKNKVHNVGTSAGKVGNSTWDALFPLEPKSPVALEPVYYSQEDPRWRNTPYTIRGDKTQTIGTSGCGPTSAAMSVSSLTGKTVLPPEAAKYAIDNGYRTPNNGTAWTFFGPFAKLHGLHCKQTGDFEDARAALAKGALVVASMRKGHFTGGGHYVVLAGLRDGLIVVYDPNHDNIKYGTDGLVNQGSLRNDGRVLAREAVIRKEAGQYWIISK
ncbi:C39 family peptidase [Paenibacillus xanthanilyticus]|uniref:C39 family peptidase n=1 Tax=Paenibacillus xanthanilyticus TaxID=1783531 RepID=A0ABV8KA23_9BACL